MRSVFGRVYCALCIAVFGPVAAQAQSVTARADSAWTRGDHDLAERLYRARLTDAPRDAMALHRLAILAMRRGEYDRSETLIQRLLAGSPDDAEAHVTRARLCAARGDMNGGRAIVDSILAHDPNDIGALQAKGQFLAWDADMAGAENVLRTAFALDSANLDTRLVLARTLRQQGRHAAARIVLRTVSPDSQYDDLMDEFDWIARALDPRAASVFVYEEDSDGNAIATLVMNAAARPLPRVEVRADAWIRDARVASADHARQARGASVAVWTQSEPGWAVSASAGASASDSPAAETLPSWSMAVSTPAREQVTATLSIAQTPFNATAPAIENRIRIREASLDVRWSPSRAWRVSAATAAGEFDAGASGQRNRRWRAQAELVRRLNDTFGLALAGRGFGFEHDRSDGYFDPDVYGVAELGARLRRERRHWHIDAELAPGIERIGSRGNAAGSLRATAAVTYLLRPGREIRLNTVIANSGIEQLSATRSGDYRYRAAGVSVLWRF